MSEFRALIVAAGRGIRMGARGQMTPKGLLKIDGVPLVMRSVRLLQARGISHVRIVTGHLSDQYEAMFRDMPGVELVHNPAFSTTGSLLSLATGLNGLHGPLLVLESDLIYEAASLVPLSAEASTILASGTTGSGDEVYIWTRQNAKGEPVFDDMSKDVSARSAKHHGELVGISAFTASDVEALHQAAAQILKENPKSDYEPAVVRMAKTRDICCHKIDDLAWTEIDDEVMYERALNTVWPAIQKRDATP